MINTLGEKQANGEDASYSHNETKDN